MSWGVVAVGLVSAGVSYYNSKKQADAVKSASQQQVDAARQAGDYQREMALLAREDQAPWRAAGSDALGQLRDLMKPGGELTQKFSYQPFDFQADPGFQFRLQQGQQALDRSAASRGGALSGAAAKALSRYSSDLASQEYQNAYNRYDRDYTRAFNTYQTDRTNRFNQLAALAGLGQTAANQMGSFAIQGGSGYGNYLTQAANAQAAGMIGQSNAWTSGLQNIGNNLSQYAFMRNMANQWNNPQQQQYQQPSTGSNWGTGGSDWGTDQNDLNDQYKWGG